jgi:transcriptional regulator with XRE-family HTH domain
MDKQYPTIDMYRTGQTIRWIMRLRGLTVREVQEFLELTTPQSVYHWINGRNMPTIDNLYALSELFRVPVDAMLRGNRRETFYFEDEFSCRRFLAYYEAYRQRRDKASYRS